jgi:hypothetical protein
METMIECPHCAGTIDVSNAPDKFSCPHCDGHVQFASPSPSVVPRTSGEEPLFNAYGIQVTRTRFLVSGHMFPIANISSIRMAEIPPSTSGEVLLLVFGLLIGVIAAATMADGIGAWAMLFLCGGALTVIGAIVLLARKKSSYSVVLTTAGGEIKAYTSPDRQFIANVIGALNQAIVARG